MKSKKNLIIVIALSVVLFLGAIAMLGNINGFHIDVADKIPSEPLCIHSYTSEFVPTSDGAVFHVNAKACEKCGIFKEGVREYCTVIGDKGDSCIYCGREHTAHTYSNVGAQNYIGAVAGSGGGEGTYHQLILKCVCCDYTKTSANYEPCSTPCTACGYGVEAEAPVE